MKKLNISLFTLLALALSPLHAEGFTSPGKPEHPIRIDVQSHGKPVLGETLPVTVAVSVPGYDVQDVSVSVRSSGGLSMLSSGQQFKPLLASREVAQQELKLMPAGEGMQELVILVTARVGDQLWRREFHHSIPVGNVVEKPREVISAPTVEAHDGLLERREPASQVVTRGN